MKKIPKAYVDTYKKILIRKSSRNKMKIQNEYIKLGKAVYEVSEKHSNKINALVDEQVHTQNKLRRLKARG